MSKALGNRLGFRISATLLAIFAAVSLVLVWQAAPTPVPHPGLLVFFLLFGLFTIVVGFPHPYYGHVSFDRVAQYSSLLIFGPFWAAAINGACSLLYPLRNLWRGQRPTRVLDTSLANAGMMVLVILFSGAVYMRLGGRVPLQGLEQTDILPLVAMALCAHFLNEGVIAWLVWIRGGDVRELFSPFEYGVEGLSFLIAVCLALSFNGLDDYSFALLAVVVSVGMIILHRFAHLRISLEEAVSDRTRALEEKSRELENLANEDSLTGLANRRYANRRLDEEVRRAERYRRPFSVALVDLDFFKRINDLHSHATGDAVLRATAELLQEQMRDSDLVARYGGEEFVLVMPETSLALASTVCERLRQTLAATDFDSIQPGLKLTLSAGVAEFEAGDSVESLLGRADRCLYIAKDTGRNRVSPSPRPRSTNAGAESA